jgi:hypothetical protein|uniref:Uncharacterized protein n=1 Tax=viral metagenome TaxID=1070528 RepID=A0A6C0HEP2_9ZZZZ
MNLKENILTFVPAAVLLGSGFLPIYGLLQPIVTFFILYIITMIVAKTRCKNMSVKDISKKSLAPLSYYIALTMLAILGVFVPFGLIGGVDMLFNNIFAWIVIGYLYKITFNKIFSC